MYVISHARTLPPIFWAALRTYKFTCQDIGHHTAGNNGSPKRKVTYRYISSNMIILVDMVLRTPKRGTGALVAQKWVTGL